MATLRTPWRDCLLTRVHSHQSTGDGEPRAVHAVDVGAAHHDRALRSASPTARISSSSSAPPPASTNAVGGSSNTSRQRAMLAATVSCLIANLRLRHSSAASRSENGTSPAPPRVHSLPIASDDAGELRKTRRPSSSWATCGPSTRTAGVRLTVSARARGIPSTRATATVIDSPAPGRHHGAVVTDEIDCAAADIAHHGARR